MLSQNLAIYCSSPCICFLSRSVNYVGRILQIASPLVVSESPHVFLLRVVHVSILCDKIQPNPSAD